MAVYAAMIDRMDVGIGRVLDALKRLGAEGNTLVLFLSDNGASAEALDSWPNPARGHRPGTPTGAGLAPLAGGRLGQCGQHAIPRAQDVDARRWHRYATRRVVAGGDRGPRSFRPRWGT